MSVPFYVSGVLNVRINSSFRFLQKHACGMPDCILSGAFNFPRAFALKTAHYQSLPHYKNDVTCDVTNQP